MSVIKVLPLLLLSLPWVVLCDVAFPVYINIVGPDSIVDEAIFHKKHIVIKRHQSEGAHTFFLSFISKSYVLKATE